MSAFIRGTFILIVAAMVTKVLGFVHRMVLANLVGEEGVGLYMMTFPTLMLVITITQIGLPVAIANYIARATAQHDAEQESRIVSTSFWITGTLAAVFTPLMIVFAPALTTHLFADDRTFWPFVAILPIVPIAAVSAVMKGYFQGKQQMMIPAAGQLIEQIIRIAMLFVIVSWLMPYGIEFAAAGAMLASIAGELASLLYLAFTFRKRKKATQPLRFSSFRETAGRLLGIALPSTGSRLIGSVAWFLEPIIVMKCLVYMGLATAAITREYGVLTGFVLPLLLLPSFITTSLSTALVPSISEARAANHHTVVTHRVNQALRLSLVTGGLFSILLFLYASPFLTALYSSDNGSEYVTFLALLFFFYYYQGPLHAVLQVYDAAKTAMVNSLIGALVKIAVMVYFLLQPGFGMMGTAIGIAAGLVTVTLLHFFTVVRCIPFSIPYRQFVSMAVIIGTVCLLHSVMDHLHAGVPLLLSAVLFITLSCMFRLVKSEDWSFIRRLKR